MRLQHAKRVKSKSRPRQRKPNPPKPGQQRMLVVDRACGRSGTLTGGFLRASTQRPDGESCLALPMEQSIGKANSGRFGSSGKMQVSITLRALWWAIKAHRGQQWPEGHFTRSDAEQGKVPYGTVIVFG